MGGFVCLNDDDDDDDDVVDKDDATVPQASRWHICGYLAAHSTPGHKSLSMITVISIAFPMGKPP